MVNDRSRGEAKHRVGWRHLLTDHCWSGSSDNPFCGLSVKNDQSSILVGWLRGSNCKHDFNG